MLPIKISLPADFLKEENRNGYVVSEDMKKVWAVQLDLLNEIDRVCEKYDLEYFADGGTLIGAVREKGYIPWDDDIDLFMKREDYDKLVQLGEREFKQPYFLQNGYSDNFFRGFARLRNSDTTALTKNDFKFNINKGIFIDIFPLDTVTSQAQYDKKWINRNSRLLLMIRIGAGSNSAYYSYPKKFGVIMLNKLYKYRDPKKAFKKYEQSCNKWNVPEAEYYSLCEYRFDKLHTWPKSLFSSSIRVPFEFTTICIPNGYDSRLRQEFGDYMTPVKAPSEHGRVLYDAEVDYKTYLATHSLQEIWEYVGGRESGAVSETI